MTDLSFLSQGAREAFRMVACPGGPILEIPQKGKFIFERLSPGTIREEDYYEEFRIVPGGRPGTRLLVACPRGATRKGVCTVGQRVLRIWHDRRREKELLRRCRTGELARKRQAIIRRINEDIERLRKGLSVRRGRGIGDFGLIAPGREVRSPLRRLGQFVLTMGLVVLVTILVLKFFFPGVMSSEAAVVAAAAPRGLGQEETDDYRI